MARIPDEVLQRLKNEVSLVRLIESQGIELKKHGKDYLGLCPFHDDKEPSLIVTPANNLWNCLGACGTGGSVIDWVMKRDGVSFRRAVDNLQRASGMAVSAPTSARSTLVTQSSSLVAEKDEQQALKRVIEFYHETLKQSPEALAYLESRGLNHPELINTFKLGFANRTLAYQLPPKNRKSGAEIRGRLQSIGILRASGHEHFNGSIVVPVIRRTEDGGRRTEITEVYGRKILGSKLRKGTAQHLYLPGPHQGIWNPSCLAADEIILCESLIDAMTFWVNGFEQVTTSYGTNGFTEELLAGITSNQIKRVLIAYDRDEAGNSAADRVAEQLKKYAIDCYRVLFPKNMDANEYARNMSPARKSLELVIRKAEPMLEAKARGVTNEVSGVAQKAAEKSVTIPEQGEAVETKTKLPASPMPTAPGLAIEAQVTKSEIIMCFGARRYRVRGLSKAMSYEQLKINLCVTCADPDSGDLMHVDHLDLYHAKQRSGFIKQASIELGANDETIKKDLTKVLLKLEQLQDEQIQRTLKPEIKAIELTTDEEQHALELLRSPNLVQRIVDDFALAGLVGENSNTLCGYLACVSRKLDNPLAVMIQSASAAGKSALMDAVLALMPEEERVHYSAMTGQSLFYMGATNLKHKILAIAEEEGAHNASYALKLLQSEGEVSIASTAKDEASGDLITKDYKVEGPVMLFLTTTAIEIDEELLNRCLVLTVNESRTQTESIHRAQRTKRTLSGLKTGFKKTAVIQNHRNAQRLIKPLKVINPFAEHLTFLSDKTRTRRDHEKYLTLIDAIALLHQHQREVKTIAANGERLEYIEVSLDDIAIANDLAHEILGRTLDELPPQTRKLLKQIQHMVMEDCQKTKVAISDYRFSRKQIRIHSGWGNTQIKIHCKRLEDMEYLLVHRGRRGLSMEYELLFDGQSETQNKHLMGLIDVETLNYDAKKSGTGQNKSLPSRPQVGGVSALEEQQKAKASKASGMNRSEISKSTTAQTNNASYRSEGVQVANTGMA